MNRVLLVLLAACVAASAGCFPILLDVDKTGRVLIPRQEGVFSLDTKTDRCQLLWKPDKGTAAWARWSPNGQMILVGVVKEGQGIELSVVDLRTRNAKSLGTFQDMTCAFWSPEGKAVSVAISSGDEGCDLSMINLLTNEQTELLSRALPMHRWLPGGRVVAFTVEQQREEAYFGELVIINAANSDLKMVASAICDKSAAVDVSPDGKSALLIEWTMKPGYKLTLVDLKEGTKTTLADGEVMNAFWSPDGKHIAIVKQALSHEGRTQAAGPSEGPRTSKPPDREPAPPPDMDQREWHRMLGEESVARLVVTDAQGKNEKTVATEVVTETSSRRDRRPVYPSWANNDTVLYFEMTRVYGVAGTSLRLMSVKADGSERKCLQAVIDEAAAGKKSSSPSPRR